MDHLARFVEFGGEAEHIDQWRAQIVADDIGEALNLGIGAGELRRARIDRAFERFVGALQSALRRGQIAVVAQDQHDRGAHHRQQQEQRDPAHDIELHQRIELAAIAQAQFFLLVDRHLFQIGADRAQDHHAFFGIEILVPRAGGGSARQGDLGIGQRFVDLRRVVVARSAIFRLGIGQSGAGGDIAPVDRDAFARDAARIGKGLVDQRHAFGLQLRDLLDAGRTFVIFGQERPQRLELGVEIVRRVADHRDEGGVGLDDEAAPPVLDLLVIGRQPVDRRLPRKRLLDPVGRFGDAAQRHRRGGHRDDQQGRGQPEQQGDQLLAMLFDQRAHPRRTPLRHRSSRDPCRRHCSG